MTNPIKTLLIANRGEIALRIMRTAKAMGLRTIAVYSDADADSPHVKLADAAVPIGAPPVAESYLDGDKIIAAAKANGADAIHPGYGLLAENASFARAVEAAGLVFVGPTPGAIETMGDKARAKRKMIEAGVPCVPGYQGDDQSDETLVAQANMIGFPLMVKASAGGGGRGMRLVSEAKNITDAIAASRAEAKAAFGDDVLILEKAIIRPRHVEIQVFADAHGNIVHLGERDCSVQRRHQKVIEEAPSPVVTNDIREKMGSAALSAAAAVGYRGAGTVEFLLDGDGVFYFLEMNTRIQVEHPVTEMVTGLDLVRMQIEAAQGQPLAVTQDDIVLTGHAIEARLCAEHPDQDFLPSTGPVLMWKRPAGEGMRVDDGIESGGNVSPFYDSMVAKIIASGATREIARRRLIDALKETFLVGVASNRDFLIDALQRDAFVSQGPTTAFISEVYGDDGYIAAEPDDLIYAIAAALFFRWRQDRHAKDAIRVPAALLGWSSAGRREASFHLETSHSSKNVHISVQRNGSLDARIDDRNFNIEIASVASSSVRLRVGNVFDTVHVYFHNESALELSVDGTMLSVADANLKSASDGAAAASGSVTAPMHGVITELIVAPGHSVAKGDRLFVLEAMKMQHEITAGIDGTISTIAVEIGQQVAAGDPVLEIEPIDAQG